MNNQKAFTIIELIVVIAIIAILAAIVLFNVTSYVAKGRDGRRVADLHSMQVALTEYYADNGHYPPIFPGPGSSDCSAITSSLNFIAPEMPVAPTDPSWNGSLPYTYEYCQRYNALSGWHQQTYMILAHLETSAGNVGAWYNSGDPNWYPYYMNQYNYYISNFTPP